MTAARLTSGRVVSSSTLYWSQLIAGNCSKKLDCFNKTLFFSKMVQLFLRGEQLTPTSFDVNPRSAPSLSTTTTFEIFWKK